MSLFKSIAAVLFGLILVTSDSVGFAQQSDALMLATNDFPPYAYEANGQIDGIAVDIVRALTRRVGATGEIVMLPWSRALRYSTSRKMMLFPYTRMPYREKTFKWIGPIMKDCFVFVVPHSNRQPFSNLDDFRNLRIGVSTSTPTFVRLKELGFKHLQVVSSEKLNPKKLVIAKRIDAWFIPYLIMKHTLKSVGVDESRIRIAFRDMDVEMYIAASFSVSDQTVAQWQKNFDAMLADGTYQRIVKATGLDTNLP